ncbi:MAG: tetratricopeptide repeat protein, partial [Zavarzinella sp.]|nr:tetratricopeptide repeat protein [Zavarzinella sp.]
LMASCLSRAPPADVDLVLEVAIEQHLKLLDRAYRSGKTLVDGPSGKARAQTERAIAVWLQRRPLQADQIQGLIWRGDLDLLTNRRAAVDDFRRATEIDPTHFNARLDLAIALVEYDMSEAAQHLEFLHTRDPENQQVTLLLAQVRRSLGQPEAAISLIDELLQRNPTHPAAVLERGKAALDLGRPAEAEQFLRLAVGQTPDDPLAHLALSRCLLLLGKEAESKAHEQRYQELELKRLEAEENLAASRRDWQNRTDRGERAPRPGAPMR